MGKWKDSKGSRYWTDPEYRERKLRQAREFRERHADDPIYQRIRYLESRVGNKRSQVESHQAKIDKHTRGLIRDCAELVKLRKQWHAKRAGHLVRDARPLV